MLSIKSDDLPSRMDLEAAGDQMVLSTSAGSEVALSFFDELVSALESAGATALYARLFDSSSGGVQVWRYPDNEDDDIELDEKATLKQFNVIPWIEKFPHWYATLSFLEPPEPDTYESIHTAVAIHKNIPDVKGYVDGLRGTPDWFELQK